MGIVLIPPMVGRRSPLPARPPDRRVRPRRRGVRRRLRRGARSARARQRADRRLRPRRPDRQLGVHPRDDDDRGGDRALARYPDGDLRASSRSPACSSSWSTICCRRSRSARAKFIVEGSVAITFATLLVLLTGGEDSPFFFTFPLIVAGAALVVSPRVTFALAAIASLGYIFATALPGSGPGRLPVTVAKVGINLTALVLLGLRRHRDRPRAAPGPRRRRPPLDRRPADRAVQPDVLLRRRRPRDRPEPAARIAASAC